MPPNTDPMINHVTPGLNSPQPQSQISTPAKEQSVFSSYSDEIFPDAGCLWKVCCGVGCCPAWRDSASCCYLTCLPISASVSGNDHYGHYRGCYGATCLPCWLVCGVPDEQQQMFWSHPLGREYLELRDAILDRNNHRLVLELLADASQAPGLTTKRFSERRTAQFSCWRYLYSLYKDQSHDPESDSYLANSCCLLCFWPTFRKVYIETKSGESLLDTARSHGTAAVVRILGLYNDTRRLTAQKEIGVTFQDTKYTITHWWRQKCLKQALLIQNPQLKNKSTGNYLRPNEIELILPESSIGSSDSELRQWLWEEQCAGRQAILTLRILTNENSNRSNVESHNSSHEVPSRFLDNRSGQPVWRSISGDSCKHTLTSTQNLGISADILKRLDNDSRFPRRLSIVSQTSFMTSGTGFYTPRSTLDFDSPSRSHTDDESIDIFMTPLGLQNHSAV